MPSHFSTIGFQHQTQDDLMSILERVSSRAKALHCEGGTYLRWAGECGEEIWMQVSPDRELVGATPFFNGQSYVKVGLTARTNTEPENPLEGALQGWIGPIGGDPIEMQSPICFDSPDYARHPAIKIPGIHRFQLVAFAHDFRCFDDVADFETSQKNMKSPLASRSFVPASLLQREDGGEELPEPMALITGHVVETSPLCNTFTGGWFDWALVKTVGGWFDVVIDSTIPHKPLAKGGVVWGVFWLTGRLLREGEPLGDRLARWWKRTVG